MAVWRNVHNWLYETFERDVDRIAPKDVRHSAQTVFMLVIFGLGPLIAGLVNGRLSKLFITAQFGICGSPLRPMTYWRPSMQPLRWRRLPRAVRRKGKGVTIPRPWTGSV